MAQQPATSGADPGAAPYNGPNQADRAAAKRGPAAGFRGRERRLVYVALPGGSAGGQFSSEMNGQGIVVLEVDRKFEFVKRIPTFNTAAAHVPQKSRASPLVRDNMIYLAMPRQARGLRLGHRQKVGTTP